MKGKRWLTMAIASATLAAAAGCSSDAKENGEQTPAAAKPPEPVTLSVFGEVGITPDDFKRLFAEPIQKKYPHITLKQLNPNSDGSAKLDNLIAAGETPDMLLITNSALAKYDEMKLTMDITPLAKQYGIDLSRFESVYLDSLRAVSAKGELFALPYSVQFTGLFYNKDLFDRRGVAYPKDGMTWEQATELARKMTFQEGDVKYRGLDPESVGRLARQLGISPYDFKTGKVSFHNDSWKKIFETVRSIYDIPGNESTDVMRNMGYTNFVTNRNLAMFATYSLLDVMKDADKNGLNWDVTEYPSFPDSPHITRDVDVHMMMPVGTTKHKEAVTRVMEVVTSSEVQTISARQTARLTPLADESIKQLVGADIPYLKGKNISGMLKGKARNAPVYTQYHSPLVTIARESFKEYMGGKDLNTVLREGEEKMVKKAAELKGK